MPSYVSNGEMRPSSLKSRETTTTIEKSYPTVSSRVPDVILTKELDMLLQDAQRFVGV